MIKIHLNHAIVSLIWFSLALAIYADYHNKVVAIEEMLKYYDEYNREHPTDRTAVCPDWTIRIPPILIVPLAIAGILTMFGYWRIALVFGVSAAATAAFRLWHWYERTT